MHEVFKIPREKWTCWALLKFKRDKSLIGTDKVSWRKRKHWESLSFCERCGVRTKEDGNIHMKQLCYPPSPICPSTGSILQLDIILPHRQEEGEEKEEEERSGGGGAERRRAAQFLLSQSWGGGKWQQLKTWQLVRWNSWRRRCSAWGDDNRRESETWTSWKTSQPSLDLLPLHSWRMTGGDFQLSCQGCLSTMGRRPPPACTMLCYSWCSAR